jgi:hypothetical protein
MGTKSIRRKGEALKTTTEIVNYLVRHYQEKAGQINKNTLPEQIDDLVRQMGEFLAERLEKDTPHKVVWEEFLDDAEEKSPSLVGVLEVLFEAQPAVRKRVHGFMRAVTAIEAERSDIEPKKVDSANSLKFKPGDSFFEKAENSTNLTNNSIEKNPPAYLYGNERAGFDSDQQTPVEKPFMVGNNAQIIYVPTEKTQFPFLFMHLGQLSETANDLNLQEKQVVQDNLQEIRSQLTGKRSFNQTDLANAIQDIWEVAPSYANALIESLQRHIDELPIETRAFIIQLHSPLH